ncbi:MAG: hypothetical protein KJ718_02580 [Nanoarchaeota archaeon]|nr:hypothetical protein [Nanoarchaeota archaeon]MBU1051416.1 hypothetical protein [Nanoarchaeota archaeon]
MKKSVFILLGLVIVFSFLGVVSAEWQENLNEGLISYYPFDESSGVMAEDVISGNDLTIYRGNFADGGILGNMLNASIIGELEATSIEEVDASILGNNPRTISFWSFTNSPNSIHTQYLVSYGLCSSNQKFSIARSANTGYWLVQSCGSDWTSDVSATREMNHHVITHNGTTMTYYLNGEVIGTPFRTYNTFSAQLYVGDWYGGAGELYNGTMDELGIWNRSLSEEEALQLWNNGTGWAYPFTFSAPTIQPIDDIFANENETLVVTINATHPENETMTYFILPEGYFEQDDNIFTWQTDFEDWGNYTFEAQVSDGYFTNSTIFNVIISNVNRPPFFFPIGDQIVNENDTLTFPISYSDPDNENNVTNDDNILTLSSPNLPPGAQLIDDIFTWTPNHWQSGFYYPTFIVSDGEFEVNETITIEVIQVDATDLTLTNDDITFSDDTPIEDQTIYITAVFYNVLEINPPSIDVGFYDGNPEDNGILIDIVTVTTRGDSYFAQVEWVAEIAGEHDIYFYLDPDNEIYEGDETNNIAFRSITVTPAPDLMIREQDIGFTNPFPEEGEEINILAMIHNINSGVAEEFNVLFYLDDISNVIWEETLSMGGYSTELLVVPWTAVQGEHLIHVLVDSEQEIEEPDESNNEAWKTIFVEPGLNNPPVLDPVGDKTVYAMHLLTIDLNASDADDDDLLYGITSHILPSKFNFDPLTGIFEWKPEREDIGLHEVTFNVTDGIDYDEETINIKVLHSPWDFTGDTPANIPSP